MGGFAEYHVMCDARSVHKYVSIYGSGSDKAIRQSTPQEKSGIFLVGTPNPRPYSPLP